MDDGKAILESKSNTKGHGNFLDVRILLCIVILIMTAVLILFCFRIYIRWLSNPNRDHTPSRRHEEVHGLFSATANDTASQGLDLSILKAIPTIVYNTESHYYQMQECPVCLSEFQENEKVRVLPKCKHAFHADCIDLWFHSHSNCALCRVPVQSVNITETTEEVTIVPVGEQGWSEPKLCENERDRIGSSSSGYAASLSSTNGRQNPLGV